MLANRTAVVFILDRKHMIIFFPSERKEHIITFSNWKWNSVPYVLENIWNVELNEMQGKNDYL
jgi:hypothetical protein